MYNYNPETIRNQISQQVLSHNYEEGPLLLLAGPGTGKTYSLITTIKEQLKNNYSIDDFIEVTLTNESVNDFTSDAKKKILDTYNSSTTLHFKAKGIIHRYAALINLKPDFSIVSGHIEEIFKQDLSIIYGSPKREISSNLRKYQEASANCDETFDQFSNLYRRLQRFYFSIDWFDVVFYAIKILENHPNINNIESGRFEFLLVDEYQDLNNADQRLIELLLNNRNTLLAVGDDDQSIYSGRFANPSGISIFTSRYSQAKTINLPVTSRLPTNVINASHRLINNNVNRLNKDKLIPLDDIDKRANGGFVISINNKSAKAENDFIGKALTLLINNKVPPNEILVLCNCKYLGSELYDFISYEFIELPINNNLKNEYDIGFEHSLISSIRKFLSDPTDNISLRVIIDVLEINHKKELSDFVNLAFQKNLSLWEAINDENLLFDVMNIEQLLLQIKRCYLSLLELTDINEKIIKFINEFNQLEFLLQYITNSENCDEPITITPEDKNFIKFMTLHSSKGLDADFIFIPFMEDSLGLPAKDIEEMRRLLYVALTRAKVGVIFSWAWSRNSKSRFKCSGTGGNYTHRIPSTFLQECGVNPSWKKQRSVSESLKLLDQVSKTIIYKDNENN